MGTADLQPVLSAISFVQQNSSLIIGALCLTYIVLISGSFILRHRLRVKNR